MPQPLRDELVKVDYKLVILLPQPLKKLNRPVLLCSAMVCLLSLCQLDFFVCLFVHFMRQCFTLNTYWNSKLALNSFCSQGWLKLIGILLFQPAKSWNYKCVPPRLV